MYVPDTLERLNNEAVAKAKAGVKRRSERCDYCDKHADYAIDVYNPADALRDVEGVYELLMICEDCREKGLDTEERFYCPDCGELFVVNHSWDVVAVTDPEDGMMYCQGCYAERIEPEYWGEIKESLIQGDTKIFTRINSIPGKKEIWKGEYSDYSDFPGHTSFGSVIASIENAGVSDDDLVYPIVSHGYQFSVVLSIYQ